MAHDHKKEIDHATGVETTGHVWDGDLKELNKPLPRWWLLTFYACTLWAVGYWVAYPAWPTLNGYTKGMLGYSQRQAVTEQVANAQLAQSEFRTGVEKTALADIAKNPEILRFASASGAAAFASNCSPCHGRGAQGASGYPNLNDDDWIWGGKIEDIEKTIQHGIRSDAKDTRSSAMPRFGLDKILDEKQIGDTAEYVLSLTGKSTDKEAAGRGAATFAEQCSVCHGEQAIGNQELGAPNLADAIWLYGGEKTDVVQTITTGRGGMMPQWTNRLDAVTIKSLAVYVHGLGGGK
ncbi:MAG: cytochrome-c oxidase, cbb3-type subunit III [Hyphomicrobium sp.]